MSNQQTIRQLLTLDNRIKQLESLFQSTNPNVSLASVSSVNPNDLKVLKDEIEKLKKNSKEITDIDKMIKTNFDETNRKFEEVNKAVNSLDANLEKANKIEKDVEELKKRH